MAMGRSPVTVTPLPAGIVHEFVAVNGQGRSWRALAALDAQGNCISPDGIRDIARGRAHSVSGWDGGYPSLKPSSNRMCEILIPLDKREIRRPAWDLGPTLLPQKVGVALDRYGTVRVRTEPSNLAVYQLIGFTPNAQLKNLPTDQNTELVVYASGYQLEKVVITPELWKDTGSTKHAVLDISLKARFH